MEAALPGNVVPQKATCKILSSPNVISLARTRVGTLIVATVYLQLIQNRYMFRRFTVLQCSHQQCGHWDRQDGPCTRHIQQVRLPSL